MEAVGASASILAIAGAGIQISLRLIAFADQVGTAPKRIQDVGTDVSVTAGTLQELGKLMRELPTKRSAGMFNLDQVQNIEASSNRCKEIFDDLRSLLGKASQQLRSIYESPAKSHEPSPKIKLSKLERMKWPFLQPSMGPLQSALRDAKGTLTLILQVVHLRHAHITASLGREEQNDLIRMIAAIRRQQLASLRGDEGGFQVLDASDTEESDSEVPSKDRTILEAWSVTPNTFSDDAFQHFLITPIPVSQQQITKLLKTSPQDFREVASMIDSLSVPERDVILGRLLDMGPFGPDDSTIRSISSQSWTGSHDLFGDVGGRKFKLIIERQVRSTKSSQTNKKRRSGRHGHYCDSGESDASTSDSFSESDTVHDTEAYRRRSSPQQLFREHRRRRRAPAPPRQPPAERRQFSYYECQPEQEVEEKKRIEQTMPHKQQAEKKKKKEESPDTQPWTEPQPPSISSDDDLVKSLLTQYTNFEPGEPLVQVSETPPPSYDEAFIIPKRVPRPY